MPRFKMILKQKQYGVRLKYIIHYGIYEFFNHPIQIRKISVSEV